MHGEGMTGQDKRFAVARRRRDRFYALIIALAGLCFFANVGWITLLGLLVTGSEESDDWVLESTVVGMTFITVLFLIPLFGAVTMWILNHQVVASELQHRQIAWLVQKIGHDSINGEEA